MSTWTSLPEVQFRPVAIKIERYQGRAPNAHAEQPLDQCLNPKPTNSLEIREPTYTLTPTPDNPAEGLLELIESDVAVFILIKVLEGNEVIGIRSFQDYQAGLRDWYFVRNRWR
jgi:hypothetical protein